MANEPRPFLLWSTSRFQWWKPNAGGFTSSLYDAGTYTDAELKRIMANIQRTSVKRVDEVVPKELAKFREWTGALDQLLEGAAEELIGG